MKKITNSFFTLLLMITASVCFTGCSSDDKDGGGGSGSPAREIEGTYTGKLTGWQGVSSISDVTLKITTTSNSKIKLEFIGDNLPTTATTEVYWVGDDQIWGKTPLLEYILYYADRKSITYAPGSSSEEIYYFAGTKK